MSSSLSISGPEGKTRPGKFNVGVVMGGGGVNLLEMEVWSRLDPCLGWMWSLHRRCHYWGEPGDSKV